MGLMSPRWAHNAQTEAMKTREWWRRVDHFVPLALALSAIPIAVAVIRAILDGWIPLGDQALLQIRARDVLTAHHPFLGTASSAALNRTDVVPLNHPGPLMFDVLALPVRLFGAAGMAIGVGLVNTAAAAIGTTFAARRAGRAGATLAALTFAGLGWSAGSESLYDPYNPTAAMIPCLACLFLAWCVVDRDDTAVLWLIGVASFAVQLNNSYLLFLTPLVAATCAMYVVRCYRSDIATLAATVRRSLGVFVVLWSQPLFEQLVHGRDGNIARMLKASSVLGNNPGSRLGTQIAAATLAAPPWWGRSEFAGIRLFSPLPRIVIATAALLLVLVVCAVGCWWTWRRRGDAAAALLTAGTAVAIAWVATIRSPMSSFFGLSSDYVRWLWPASVFIWFAAALTVWRMAAAHIPAGFDHRMRTIGAVLAILAVSLTNVPRYASLESQSDLDALRPQAIELIEYASSRVDGGAVLYRPPPGYDVYGVPLLARLQRDGIEFFVDDPVLVRQFGDRRRYRGQALPELRVVTAMDAVDAQRDPNAIAFISALSAGDRAELQAATLEIAMWLLDGEITLSEAGKSAVEAGFGDPWLSQLGDPELDGTTISRSNALAASIQSGLLDADPRVLNAMQRFATLRQSVETSTVAVLLVPVDQVAADSNP